MVSSAHAWTPAPKADERVDLQQAAARIAVDPVAVKLDGVHVADTRELAAHAQTERIEPLIRALNAREADWHARNPTVPFAKELGIAAEKSVPFRVVRKLLFSAAQAGFEAPRFETIEVPSIAQSRGPDKHARIVGVWIKREGYVFSAEELSSIAKTAGRYDLDALRRMLEAQKKLNPELGTIVILPDDSVRFEDVAHVMSSAIAAGIPNLQFAGESPPTKLSDLEHLHETISKAVIRDVIGKGMPDVRACYSQYLKQLGPGAASPAGRIDTKLAVGPTGAVGEVVVTNTTLHEQPIQQCLLDVLRRLRFPPPEGGGQVVISYPFVFAP